MESNSILWNGRYDFVWISIDFSMEFDIYRDDRLLFYNKIKGYDSDDNTWEPEDNFASMKGWHLRQIYINALQNEHVLKMIISLSGFWWIFSQLLVLMEYHSKRNKLKKKCKSMDHDAKPSQQQIEPKPATDEKIYLGEFLSADYIREQNLLPKKVLNITHIKGEQKNLVAEIQFDGEDDPAFVFIDWANEHCPQLVISFYESRILWEKKS